MIQKLRSFLRRRGIKARMFFSFIVLPIGVMVLMFLLYYFSSLNIIVSKNRQSSQKTVDLMEENINLNTTKMKEQLQAINKGALMLQVFTHPSLAEANHAFETFMKDNLYLADRKNLQLYTADGTLLYDEQKTEKNVMKPSKKAWQAQKTMQWWYDFDHQEIRLVSPIDQRHERLGYIVCSFDDLVFSPSFAKADSANSMLIVVDEKGHYLFGSSTLKEHTQIDTAEKSITLDKGEYYVESKQITNMNWKVVNLVSSDYLLEEFHNFRNMILIYGIVIACILEIIASIVYHSIYDPLHNLLKTMRNIDENNLIVSRVEDDGNDEIHEVATNFNELLDRVEELLKTVEMEQEQKRETQFQLLQAQINPHFLFNTLNTLHFLAIMNEDKPVSEGISALAKLLRNTIVDSKEVVSVNEEIENLKNYIIIQKLRFGDLFETVYNVDDEVKDCQILKFLLQPIVENAILHAFEEDKEHQMLTVRVRKQLKYLKIEIGDNGKGFQQNAQEKKKTSLSGIGIGNIQDRIQLMYGSSYSMDIKSVPSIGTIVTLLLPYVKGDSECIKY